MKAYLEMKAPKGCDECRFLCFAETVDGKIPFCQVAVGQLIPKGIDIKKSRPLFCPLKIVMTSKELTQL